MSFLLHPAVNVAFAALPGLIGVVALIAGGRAPSTASRWLVRIAGVVLILDAALNGGMSVVMSGIGADPSSVQAVGMLWSVGDILFFIAMLALLMAALGLTGKGTAKSRPNTAAPAAAGPGAPGPGGPQGPGWGGPAAAGGPAGGPSGPPVPGGHGAPSGGYPAPGGPGTPGAPGGSGGYPPPNGPSPRP